MPRRPVDPEIVACRKLARALVPLDHAAIGRVLRWLFDRHAADARRRELRRELDAIDAHLGRL